MYILKSLVNEKIERYNLDKYDGFKAEQLGIIPTIIDEIIEGTIGMRLKFNALND